MSNLNENQLEGVELEDFIDIYDKDEKKQNSFLDDLTPDLSLEQVNEIQNQKEEKPEDKQVDKQEPETLLPEEEKPVEEKPKDEPIVGAFKSLIDEGILLPFEGDKKIEDYTMEDWQDLIKGNMEEVANKVKNEDDETLSPETRAILQYEKSGGTDVKDMMMAIATAKNTYDFDISTKGGQKDIIRTYYQAKNLFRTKESLEKELNRLEDAGELEEKANEFKPMLEEMQVNEVNRRLRFQQEQKRRLQEQMELYNNSIKNTLSQPDVNGINMNNKTKNMIYSGLTTNNYQLISGRKSNLLYHMLEKKQFIEPDHALIAEVTWLLADPEGYKSAVRSSVKNNLAKETAEKIKGEQQGKPSSQEFGERKTIRRPIKNFFD